MSLEYSIEFGYGIRVVGRPAESGRPAGHIVEIHFYDRSAAVKYAAQLIQVAADEVTRRQDVLAAYECQPFL